MVETDNARFEITVAAKVKEKATGEMFTSDMVRLEARGYYKSWYEDPTGEGLGEIHYEEQEIYPETIQMDKKLYNDNFELIEVLEEIENNNDWSVDEKFIDNFGDI